MAYDDWDDEEEDDEAEVVGSPAPSDHDVLRLHRKLNGHDLFVNDDGNGRWLVSDSHFLAPLAHLFNLHRLLEWWNLPADRPGVYLIGNRIGPHPYRSLPPLAKLWSDDKADTDVLPMQWRGEPLYTFDATGFPFVIFEHPKEEIGMQKLFLDIIGWRGGPLRMPANSHVDPATFYLDGVKWAKIMPLRLR